MEYLGFIQEYRTEKSLEALSKLAAPTAKVLRNGGIHCNKCNIFSSRRFSNTSKVEIEFQQIAL